MHPRFTALATAALVLALCEASAARAFERTRSNGALLRPHASIVLDVHTLSVDEQNAVKRALSTWLTQECATPSALKLVDAHATGATTIEVKRGAVHESFAAHTDTTQSQDGVIESAVVTLDGALRFTTSDDVPADAFDVETVVLHELGHALGLAHPIALSVPKDVVMRAGTKPGKKLRALSADDVAGFCAISAGVSAR